QVRCVTITGTEMAHARLAHWNPDRSDPLALEKFRAKSDRLLAKGYLYVDLLDLVDLLAQTEFVEVVLLGGAALYAAPSVRATAIVNTDWI
ncbi:MAG: hypothetical protein M3495_11720, partial [Pseudomonadota bacterium]|nr:hypothetical protein [Pseudomonadota bacterium]